MSIKRFGAEGGTGTGGQHLPFSSAVEAGGFLYVSGQTPMTDGEVVEGGIIEQSRLAIQNCIDIMTNAGYEHKDVIHVKVDGVGERIIKWFGMMRPIDLDSF